MTLLGAIDDATNKMPAEHFQVEREDSAGYLRLFRNMVETAGIPWAIYRDRHSTLQRNDSHWSTEEQLSGTAARRTWHRSNRAPVAASERPYRRYLA